MTASPKVYDKVLVHLDCLREGRIKDRVLRLYEVWGSRDGWVARLSVEDICTVIGEVGPAGIPTKSNKATVARVRRDLAWRLKAGWRRSRTRSVPARTEGPDASPDRPSDLEEGGDG